MAIVMVICEGASFGEKYGEDGGDGDGDGDGEPPSLLEAD